MEEFRDEEYVKRKADQASERAASPEELDDILLAVNRIFSSEIQFEKEGSIDVLDESGFFVAETSFSLTYDSFTSDGMMRYQNDVPVFRNFDSYRRIAKYVIKNKESELSLSDLVPPGWSAYSKVDSCSEKPMGISSYKKELILIESHPLSLAGLIVFLHECSHAQRQSDPTLVEFNKYRRLAIGNKNNLQPISATQGGLILEDEREADAFVFRKLRHLLKPEYFDMVKKLLYRSEAGYGGWLTQVPFKYEDQV